VAAISITAPVERMDSRRQAALARMLSECIGPALPPGLSLQHVIGQRPPLARALRDKNSARGAIKAVRTAR